MAERKHLERTALWVALAGIVGAAFGAAITGIFNYLSHQNDLDAKMIELSVGILRAEPTAETTPLREWAIDVIDKRANFKFNTAQRAALLKRQLPFKGGFQPYIFGVQPEGTATFEDRISTLRQRLREGNLSQQEREDLEKEISFLESIEAVLSRINVGRDRAPSIPK